jgi:hypothetical protein
VKQRDRLCYEVYYTDETPTHEVLSELGLAAKDYCKDEWICTLPRGHDGEHRGHLVTDRDLVPPDAETVMMECEGDAVAVKVWHDTESFERGEAKKTYWLAYIPLPYDWATLGDDTREHAILAARQYLDVFAEDNPDADKSVLRCMRCCRKIEGEFVGLDLSRYGQEDLVGFVPMEVVEVDDDDDDDGEDAPLSAHEHGKLALCSKCGAGALRDDDESAVTKPAS